MNRPVRGLRRSPTGPVRRGRSPEIAAPRTLIDVLRARASADPETLAYTFLPDLPESAEPEGLARTLTVGALERRSKTLARHLVALGLRGERVLLVHPPGPEFVEAFFACLRAGVVAVPAPPPRPGRGLVRLASIAADCAARAALTIPESLVRARECAASDPASSALEWLAPELWDDVTGRSDESGSGESGSDESGSDESGSGESGSDETDVDADSPQSDAIAYLQYTSGSTSSPKGVMVSHANILANSEAIRRGFAHGPESRSLCWLPHFHDMGLIDGIVQPLFSGFPAFLMSPASFLRNPARWLQAIASHRITHSGGPNFAYDLCARRVAPDPATLDLRGWEVATNGAEPVRIETLDRFAAHFAACGFRRRAFYPAYGLAEATLKVSGGARGEGPTSVRVSRAALEAGRAVDDTDGVSLVGSGRAAEGTRIAIVDAATGMEKPDGDVGEIWVRGPGVALGYWNREAETETTFRARLGRGAARFLRTGDLGFVRAGELFVAGRAKDLVIVRGRNIHPQDVEALAVSCDAALVGSAVAAFGIEADGDERLVIVLEVPRRGADPGALLTAIRVAIVDALEIDPWAIVLVRAGGVPKTSSGKVRRSECRRAFLEEALPVVAQWRAAASPAPEGAPEGELGDDPARDEGRPFASTAGWLAARVAAKLGVAAATIDPEAAPAAHGLDSLRAIELAHEIDGRFGVAMTAVDLLASPSLASIASRIDAAAARDARGGGGGGSVEDTAPGPGSVAEPDECALSAGQRALWFLHELAPDSAAYTIAAALELEGSVDEDAFARASRALVARHASLRARLVSGATEPRQRFDVPFDAIFTRGTLAPSSPETRAAGLAERAFAPFDLSRGPLFRLCLLDAGPTKVLLVAAHHAVADLWSLSLVLRDLQALYAAERGDGDPPGARPPHPAEKVRRELHLLGSERGEAQVVFWRERLARQAAPLDLPSDRPRPKVQTYRGGVRAHRLDPGLAHAARALARSRGVTLFALLLAAYEAFLARITGAADFQVGVPASGRTEARFASLVAYLVNPVVVRADVADDPSFDEHLRRTAVRLREALENQDVPFPVLVQRLAPERDPARSPYFDTMFDLHASGDLVRGDLGAAGIGATAAFAGGVVARPIALARSAAQFDLSVTVVEEDRGLLLEVEYNDALFDASSADGLARGFETLLASVVTSPERRLSSQTLLSEEARASILREGAASLGRAEVLALLANPAGEEFGGGGGFHRLFERAAARAPGAVAVWHGESSIAYGALNRRANGLARLLRGLGVGPESCVVLGIEKSIDLVAAAMGVLKAGGAYVPVDPSLPLARRRALVEDCGARLVVARASGFLGDGAGTGAAVLDEGAWASLDVDGARGENLLEGARPDNLAYVVYTSGTTGAPKGVGVTHANLRSAFEAWVRDYDLLSLPAHLQMAAPGFDVFSGDLARALGSGGVLILCDREVLLDPAAFAALARRRGASFGDFVPAVARELAAHLERSGERLPQFRLVSVGSDAWTMADYDKVRRGFGPDARIINSYGVTEATIDNAYGDILPGDAVRAVPPIGRPLAHTSAYVLDARLEPLPAGVRGELYLGGPGVARGYVGSADLTAARFVPDPHGEPGARLYRTGDRVRRLSDGRIVFDGRADGQIKVRAHRIEPAEIESAMASHPEVRAAVAGARTIAGSLQIVVWIVPLRRREGLREALREHAAARLPEYMAPAAIVLLDALPLSASGKIDRKALPDPGFADAAFYLDIGSADGAKAADPDATSDATAPASATERILAGIFARALGTGPVGRDAHFFRLGGDSILAIQVVARAREAGLRLAPSLLFEHPTLADLARAVDAPGAGAAGAAREDRPEALTPIQRWFFEQSFADPGHWNMALALETRAALDPDLVRRAWRALAGAHDALRARFERAEGGWRRVVDAADGRELACVTIAPEPGESLDDAAARGARALTERLDLARGPLAGLAVIAPAVPEAPEAPEAPGGPGSPGAPGMAVAAGSAPRASGEGSPRGALVLVAHHLVVDGVSLRLILEDFERAYTRLERGVPAELPAASVSARTWTTALAEAVREGRFARETDHYARLDGSVTAALGRAAVAAAALEAAPAEALEAAPAEALEATTATRRDSLDAPATSALLASVAARGMTLETALLAALACAAARTKTAEPAAGGAAGSPEPLFVPESAGSPESGGRLYVELESHGRDTLADVDVTRTVGWFTQTRPVLVETIDPRDPEAAVDGVLRAVRSASSGGYASLRHLSADPAVREALARVPAPPIAFNYLGRFDGVLAQSALFLRLFEPEHPTRSPRGRRTHALEIDASVVDGRLSVRWSWSRERIGEVAIARLSDGMHDALGALARPGVLASADAGDALALTPLQEGMLFHHLQDPGRDPYVSQIALELTGDVDPRALARAWAHTARTYEALRTSFVWEGVPRPLQIVHAGARLPVAIHDVDDGAIDDVSTPLGVNSTIGTMDVIGPIGVIGLMARLRETGFDPATAPLARVDLVRTGARRWQMVFTHHHLLLDGWSLPIVLETVFAAYESLAATPDGGAPVSLAARGLPESTGPRAFLAWLTERDLSAEESWFRERLAGLTGPTPAPDPSGTRDPAIAARGAHRESGVAQAPAPQRMRERARALGVTPAAVVQAAWALVLAASTGARDVVFGATSSGRSAPVPGITSAVGLFINTLPLRVRLDGVERAGELVRRVQADAVALQAHEHAPLSLVQRCAETARGAPLFETLLVFENYPIDVDALGRRARFDVTGIRLHEETNYPLTIVVGEGRAPHVRAIYDRARYDEDGARAVLGRLTTAIEDLLARPAARVDEIAVLSPGEAERLLIAGSDTRRDYPRDATVAEVFDGIARSEPERVALLHEGGALTYGQLRERAGRVSRALRARGIGAESRVALAMARSEDLIVAILGTLGAGAAYVPVDPDSPPERTAGMLARAGVRTVVVDGNTALAPWGSTAPAPWGNTAPAPGDGTSPAPRDGTAPAAEKGFAFATFAELVAERGSSGTEAPAPVEASGRAPGAGPDSLAYVMFTSGSTGEPKGIEITNRNVLRLVLGAQYARFGPEQTILQLAPVSFDASTFEIWGALLHGGRLAIAPPGTGTPAEIVRLLERHAVTALWLTAGLFRVVVDEEGEALARVAQILAGGDVLSAAHVRRLLALGCERVVNGYGPTETTTFACCHAMSAGDPIGARVLIGRPVANASVYALDGSMRPVPAGAPGELFIGGDGVARGYAGRPDLTAERFVPDPFGPPGSRLYRTGDVARWRDDGRLDFLGRRDGQTKIRGFRVELAEAETGLARVPVVREATVLARETDAGRELVGYVVTEPGGSREPGPLREALASIVPRYMIPSRFVFLDALPLTAHGKIDRAALARTALPSAVPVRPRSRELTAVEEAVAGLWRRVIGVAPRSPEDDFFELGGHSLHAVRLLAAMRRAFRIDLPMAVLFESTTLGGHAASLLRHEPSSGHLERVARALRALDAMSDEERARRRGTIARPAMVETAASGSAESGGSVPSSDGAGAGEDA